MLLISNKQTHTAVCVLPNRRQSLLKPKRQHPIFQYLLEASQKPFGHPPVAGGPADGLPHGETPPVPDAGVRAAVNQMFHGQQLAVSSADVQRRLAFDVLGVKRRARIDERLRPTETTVSHRWFRWRAGLPPQHWYRIKAVVVVVVVVGGGGGGGIGTTATAAVVVVVVMVV